MSKPASSTSHLTNHCLVFCFLPKKRHGWVDWRWVVSCCSCVSYIKNLRFFFLAPAVSCCLPELCLCHCSGLASGWLVFLACGVTSLLVWIEGQFYFCSIWHHHCGLRRKVFRLQITPCFGSSYDSRAGSSTLNHSSSDWRSCLFVFFF